MKPFLLSIASIAVLVLLCNPILAQSDSVAMLAGAQPVFNPTTELPIQLCRDYLVAVEGSIGTLENLTFIIDTGTYPSIVDQRIATTLGLSEREGNAALVGHITQATLATLPFVAVGPARVESVPVLVQDLSSLERTLGRRMTPSLAWMCWARTVSASITKP